MGDGFKIISGIIFLVVAVSLPVTIFMVNQNQDIRQQADEIPTTLITTTPGCPAVNSDGTTNTCRPQAFCNTGETVKYDGNDMCTTSLGRQAFCCTQPAQ